MLRGAGVFGAGSGVAKTPRGLLTMPDYNWRLLTQEESIETAGFCERGVSWTFM